MSKLTRHCQLHVYFFKKINSTRTYWHRNDYSVVLVVIEAMHVWCKIKAWHDIVVLDNTYTNLHASIFKIKIIQAILLNIIYIYDTNTIKNHTFSSNFTTNYGIFGRNKQSYHCEFHISFYFSEWFDYSQWNWCLFPKFHSNTYLST